MKVKVIDPAGVHLAGKILPAGSEIEIAGPHLDAWLRFGQVEKVAAVESEKSSKRAAVTQTGPATPVTTQSAPVSTVAESAAPAAPAPISAAAPAKEKPLTAAQKKAADKAEKAAGAKK